MVQCAVVGCKNRPEVQRNLKFHRFPLRNLPLAVKWNSICVPNNPSNLSGAKNRRICSRHFRDEDYRTISGIRSLIATAVPSLHFSADVNNPLLTPSHVVNVEVKLGSAPFVFVAVNHSIIRVNFTNTQNDVNDRIFRATAIVSHQETPPLEDIQAQRDLQEEKIKNLRGQVMYWKGRSSINRNKKMNVAKTYKSAIATNRRRTQMAKKTWRAKYIKTLFAANGYRKALEKLFTQNQIQMLVSGRKHILWNNEENNQPKLPVSFDKNSSEADSQNSVSARNHHACH
ncbi:THAP domain-containing protein 1 [Folsomia candida]|uniref:THAP domain-containing protein 1 n=1 Tax=Folsomia candida TaxID=158441 RepID=A0A226DX48_FOLCA|nr:THAP domain-containing protein 1 [Folsomia candida]